MAVVLAVHAKEKSSCVITVNFFDENKEPVVPNEVLWTWTDTEGTVVNSREDESVTPDESVDIMLWGDDLKILSGEANQGVRVFTVKATYDSDLGLNRPLNGSVVLIVDNLLKVS